ncbi:YunG family protein [Amycolatopsis coloradensis]|uniref:YunG family protein n=1 Tax=Amycolatopsis coloradensis TaxID=76021 RepID=UPI003CC541CD
MTTVWSLTELEAVFRRCWDERTCDPVNVWDSANPAAGHCGVTSMAVAELLGGVLLWSEVFRRDGRPDGLHYWNRLPSGLEFDLARDQFRDGEHSGESSVHQPIRIATARMAARYDLFASRVRACLGGLTPEGIPAARIDSQSADMPSKA